MKPLCIDLFCGLGGWAEGFLAEGYDVVGFDIERHDYGTGGYPGQLVLQDVLTLHGSQFRNAAVIVASPPCQEFSYMAMPWSRAKQIARALRGEDDFPQGYTGSRTVTQLRALFDACFRIAQEAGVPLVVENVRGACPWVGQSVYNFGSFHLWGDVPALMPSIFRKALKVGVAHRADGVTNFHQGAYGHKVPGFRFDGSGRSFQTASVEGRKGKGSWFGDYQEQKAATLSGVKCGGDWFNDKQPSISQMCSSKSTARKAASAQIAKIPFPLAQHIARVYRPDQERCA